MNVAKTLFAPAFALALLAAPVSAPAFAKEKAAKTAVVLAAPPAGQGQVVFFRPGSMMGMALGCHVREDGKLVGNLANGKYYVQSFAPGKHVFTASSEATDTLNMEVESGETYYVKCGIGMGVVAGRPNLSPVEKAVFDEKSAKLKLKAAADLEKERAKDAAKKK
jgi:Protein of unknown function (DUF2846)